VLIVVELLIQLTAWLSNKITARPEGRPAVPPWPAGLPGLPRRWRRRLGGALLVLIVLLGTVLVLLNTVLFAPVMRYGMSRIQKRTGVEVTFLSVTGNFFSGAAQLREVTARRHNSPVSNFELTSPRVALDVDMRSILSATMRLESLSVAKLTGRFERVGAPAEGRPRKAFLIDRFALESASIRYRHTDQVGSGLSLELSRLHSEPLRSRLAAFDVFFRSNAAGSIEGAPFEIRTEGGGERRSTQWKAERIPVAALRDFVGGPLTWIKEGQVDVDVRDSWRRGSSTEIEMDWRLAFRNVRAEVPADAGILTRAVAEPVTRYINAHSSPLVVAFKLVVTEDQFEGAWSLDAAGLARAVAQSVTAELARLADVPPQQIREAARDAVDRFKQYLDERRTKPAR